MQTPVQPQPRDRERRGPGLHAGRSASHAPWRPNAVVAMSTPEPENTQTGTRERRQRARSWMSAPFAVEVAARDGRAVVRFIGKLDMTQCKRAEIRTLGALSASQGGPLVIDLAELTYCDSSGVRALLQINIAARKAGRRVIIRRPKPSVLRVITLCELDRHFTIEPAGHQPMSAPLHVHHAAAKHYAAVWQRAQIARARSAVLRQRAAALRAVCRVTATSCLVSNPPRGSLQTPPRPRESRFGVAGPHGATVIAWNRRHSRS